MGNVGTIGPEKSSSSKLMAFFPIRRDLPLRVGGDACDGGGMEVCVGWIGAEL